MAFWCIFFMRFLMLFFGFWIWRLWSEEERAQSFQTNCEVDHGATRCRIGTKAGTKIRIATHVFEILYSTLKIVCVATAWQKRGMPSVLTLKEERELVEYVKKVANLGYPSTLLQLRLKVVDIFQCQPIPWAGSKPGWSWVKWFQIRYYDLSLQVTQGFKMSTIKGLLFRERKWVLH